MDFCVACGEQIVWDEDETDYTDEGYRHWDCGTWEPETEEDERAVNAFVFMVRLEELGEIHEEEGNTYLAQRTQEALEAVAVRYTELYTGKAK